MVAHLFRLERGFRARTGILQIGVPPLRFGVRPPPTYPRVLISGVTKDSTGAALPGCTVDLYRTIDKTWQQTVVSDGSGAYAFSPVNNGNGPYYIVAYKAGAPDVAGTSVNTLLGV